LRCQSGRLTGELGWGTSGSVESETHEMERGPYMMGGAVRVVRDDDVYAPTEWCACDWITTTIDLKAPSYSEAHTTRFSSVHSGKTPIPAGKYNVAV
jgi:hypothetical protein